MGSCYNTSVINAPIASVWAKIRNFHNMDWAAGVITSVEVVGDLPGHVPGAGRVLNEAFHETLRSLSDEDYSLSYTIDDGPGPVSKDEVSDYLGEVRLIPITENDATLIEWKSSYESKADDAVGEFCNPIYRALLQALKSHFAGQGGA